MSTIQRPDFKTPQKALLVRLDKIGDLVLTLPVDESLKRLQMNCDWWVTQGLGFVLQNSKPERNAVFLKKSFSIKQFLECYKILKSQKYDLAIVFHAPWWINLLMFLAHIKIRIGVQSQWHSFLFLNRGIRQKRSLAEYSELEYNFRLIESGLGLQNQSLGRQNLILKSDFAQALEIHSLKSKQYYVVHPGMGGSALNWSSEEYIDLIDQLIKYKIVVVTGTESDQEMIKPIRAQFSNHPRVCFLDQKLSGTELIQVLQNSSACIAPSTGVIHLAASTGVKSIGIYSPVRVQHPKRWGPQGPNVITIIPPVQCPGELKCLASECKKYNCMDLISVQDVLEKVTST